MCDGRSWSDIGREITKAVRNLRQLSVKTYTKKLHLLFQKHKD